jgi:hypothetical protein
MFLRLVLFGLAASVLVNAEEQSGLQDSLKKRFTDLFRSSMTPPGFRAEEPKERLRTEAAKKLGQPSSVPALSAACAIPLSEVPIPNDKEHVMQRVRPSEELHDPIAHVPDMPVCGQAVDSIVIVPEGR